MLEQDLVKLLEEPNGRFSLVRKVECERVSRVEVGEVAVIGRAAALEHRQETGTT